MLKSNFDFLHFIRIVNLQFLFIQKIPQNKYLFKYSLKEIEEKLLSSLLSFARTKMKGATISQAFRTIHEEVCSKQVECVVSGGKAARGVISLCVDSGAISRLSRWYFYF